MSHFSSSIGITDVIHSMGALFNIVQSFPKLNGRNLNQKYGVEQERPALHSTEIATAYTVINNNNNDFTGSLL